MIAGLAASAWAGSGAEFLRIGAGARAAGMGGAFTAISDDATALYWNPAGLGLLAKRELGLGHSEWLQGAKYDFLGYAHPSVSGTWGLSAARLGSGRIESRSATREAGGGFEASDAAITVGYARSLGRNASLGASGKFISSSLGSDRATTFAADVGGVRRLGTLSLGAAVRNLGPGLRYISQSDPLPLAFAAGASARLGSVLGLALEVAHEPNDRRTSVGLGTEYAVLSGFAVRAGYSSLSSQRDGNGPLAGFGGGFGLRRGGYSLDYAFTPVGELGNVQRISLGARY